MFKKLMIRLYVAMKGIRFYTTERMPCTAAFKKSEFLTVNKCQINFFFYKEIFTDYVRKHNRTKKVQHVAYSICMCVDDNLPAYLTKYNNLKVVFKYDSVSELLEDDLDKELLLQYLNFLEGLIKESQLR